jgi:hypothetical protein
MDLKGFPCDMIDWAKDSAETLPGETGTATARTRRLGDIQLRLVDYSAGYLADHWCDLLCRAASPGVYAGVRRVYGSAVEAQARPTAGLAGC